jgi:murein DD-endopeptidase MepM/ murein hydrolase activator NlpD
MSHLRNFAQIVFAAVRPRFARLIVISAAVTLLFWSDPLREGTPPPADSLRAEPSTPKPSERLEIALKRGDTLSGLLTRHGVTPPSARELIAKVRPLLNLKKLRPGNQVELTVDPDHRTVQEMEIPLGDNIVRAKTTPQGWSVEREAIPSTAVTRVIRDTISSSLYVNGVAAGLSPEQILALARIFEYDIDFYSDFQRGDEFSVVVEELHYTNGRRVPLRVRAAQLAADGKVHNAFYFSPASGQASYFDSEGKQLRRSFHRAPLSYSRISSPYTVARRHPIFRIVRPHQAIDYAAPTGTPVVAIGAGKVAFSGRRLGYGNFVEIAHPSGYSSRYGHFSRIANGIRRGAEVNAGDVIGFVGQTGHATGPHLHFEFLQGGRKVNFLSLKIPRIEHLSGRALERFKREREENLAWLREKNIDTAKPAGSS